MMMFKSSVLLFMLATAFASASSGGDNDVIVSFDGYQIHRIRIACAATVAHDSARCHSLEQEKLDHAVWQHWISAASEFYGVTLSRADDEEVAKYLAAQHADNEKAAAHFRAFWLSVARLQQGDPEKSVYDAAAKDGVTKSELEQAASRHRTKEWLDNALSGSTVTAMEEAGRKAKTLSILIERLRTFVIRRAADTHVPYEVAEEQLWDEVSARTHTRLVDHAFHLPSKRGVLNVDERKIRVH
jgi:hypothetical protein